MNIENEVERDKVKVLASSWEAMMAQIDGDDKFDLIIMCETLYNKDYYQSLVDVITARSAPNAVVLIGTKSFYYGLSGSYFDFKTFLKDSYRFNGGSSKYTDDCLQVELKLNDMKSIERLIASMHVGRVEAATQDQNMKQAGDDQDNFQLLF